MPRFERGKVQEQLKLGSGISIFCSINTIIYYQLPQYEIYGLRATQFGQFEPAGLGFRG
jgi:hypothetical protein